MGRPAPKAWLLLWLVCGCAPDAELIVNGLAVRYTRSCSLGTPDRLVVKVVGDFPTREHSFTDVNAVVDVGDLPVVARWITLTAEVGDTRAAALVPTRNATGERDALLLPLGRSCPIGDPLAVAPPGARATSLPGGAVLITGGVDLQNAALTSAVVLASGSELAERATEQMLLRRTAHSATAIGSRVVVAGGSQDELGAAHDTYEVFVMDAGAFDAGLSARLLGGPRRDHGAAQLPDGRVLIVGGRPGADEPPLASAEAIDPVSDAHELRDAALRTPRWEPLVVTTTDGVILVLGGSDTNGAPIGEVERMDDALRFERVATLPAMPEQAAVALPGNRVGWVGCDGAGCSVRTLLIGNAVEVLTPLDTDAVRSLRQPLEDVKAVALGDGRFLFIGRVADGAGSRRGFIVDPSLGRLIEADTSRVPRQLAVLDDRTIVEIDAFGASLRRELATTPFDAPPAGLVSAGPDRLALDAPSHWSIEKGSWTALGRARLDLPGYVFADVDIRVALQGVGTLLLDRPDADALKVEFAKSVVRIGDCEAARVDGTTVELSRIGDMVRLDTGRARVRCDASELPTHVTLGIVLNDASVLTEFEAVRR